MGKAKWTGGVAIQKSTSATHQPAISTNARYPVAESAQTEGTPITYTRQPTINPDVDSIFQAGHEFRFSIGNITPSPDILGFLAALALGSDTWSTASSTHTIAPADDLPWCCVYIDRGLDFGSSVPTEVLVGCKIDTFSLEIPINGFAKLSIGGVACAKGTAVAAITGTIPTGANLAPLAWSHLRGTASSYFKVGYAALGTAPTGTQDDTPLGFKMSLSRGITRTGVNLGSLQPTDLRPGLRKLTFELSREFSGTNALSDYNAWSSHQVVGVEWKAAIGTNWIVLDQMIGAITAPVPGEIGAGEDIIAASLVCQAYKPTANAVLGFKIKDNSTAAYA